MTLMWLLSNVNNVVRKPHYWMSFSTYNVSDLFFSKFTVRIKLDKYFGMAKSENAQNYE